MKTYMEEIKDFKKAYFYVYCPECDDAWIHDLWFMRTSVCCPKCARPVILVREDHILRKDEVRKMAKDFLKKEKEKQEEMKKKAQSEQIRNNLMQGIR